MKDLLKWITTNLVNLPTFEWYNKSHLSTKKLVLTYKSGNWFFFGGGGWGIMHLARVTLSVWEDVWWFSHCFAHFDTPWLTFYKWAFERAWLVGCVFTSHRRRSVRDGTPIYCPLLKTLSSGFNRPHQESNHRPSRGSPLH